MGVHVGAEYAIVSRELPGRTEQTAFNSLKVKTKKIQNDDLKGLDGCF
jgi:hypothetical protein